MGRFACIDKSSEARESFKSKLEGCVNSARASVGHLEPSLFYACSKEQASLSQHPDTVLVGPNFSIEESFNCCRELKASHPNLPIAVFFSPENYSLRNVKRLEAYCNLILLTDDKPIRIIHGIESLQQSRQPENLGRLMTCLGVKGGVGTTSIVGALAHAGEVAGKTVVIADLSLQGVIPYYMGTESKRSHEYRYLLQEDGIPDASTVKKMVKIAPNGVHVLLPPSGGIDIRERWLRNEACFEQSLRIIEFLRADYDLVIVDIGGVEGILPFALNSTADVRLLVSSNEAASVHLLRNSLASIRELPGTGDVCVLINQLSQHGIHVPDIIDYLSNSEELLTQEEICTPLAYDPRAGAWIGSQNSFYTEGSSSTKKHLLRLLHQVLGEELEKQQEGNLLSTIKSFLAPSPAAKPAGLLPEKTLAPEVKNDSLYKKATLVNS